MVGKAAVALFVLMMIGPRASYSSPSGVTYQGRILRPDGRPLAGGNVQFRLQIRTPESNNCLLYEEIKALDMRNSKGLFSLTLNDGSGTRTDSSGYGLDRIFANRGTFTFNSTTCSSGSSYTPSDGDGRRLQVHFKDESMSDWEPMPATNINYVPFAFEAKQVQGFNAESLVRVQEADGTMGNIAPLSNANYLDLLNLIGGTSPNYVRASNGAGARVPVVTGNPLSPVAGSVWFDSVSGKLKFHDGSSAVDVGGGAGGGVTEVTAGSGLVTSPGAGITATGSIAIAVGGVVTNMLADGSVTTIKIGDSQVTDLKLAANSVIEAKIANGAVTSAKILDGTIAGSDLAPDITISTTGSVTASGFTTTGNVTVGGNVTVTGDVRASSVDSGLSATRQLRLFDPDTSSVNKITFTADAALNADYTLKWPLTAGSANQVLSTDGLGNLSWVNASSGADNLGNHTATQNIQLGNHWLSGDGGNEGLRVDANGNVGIGTTTPSSNLEIATPTGNTNFRMTDGNLGHSLTSILPTNTFFSLDELSNTAGGTEITSIVGNSSNSALQLTAISGVTNPGQPVFRIKVAKKSGTSSQALSASEAAMSLYNGVDSILSVNGGGDLGTKRVLIGDTTGTPNRPLEVRSSLGPAIQAANGVEVVTSSGVNNFGSISFNPPSAGLPAPGSIFYGTTGNFDIPDAMTFTTNNAERIRITNDGNVGVGTTNPTAPLEVSGLIKSSGISSGGTVASNLYNNTLYTANGVKSNPSGISTNNTANVTGTAGYIGFSARGVGGVDQYSFLGSVSTATGYTPHTVFGQSTSATNYIERMRIDSAGNVGIGMTNPETKLQVAGIISPSADNTHNLGTAALRFKDIYAANNVIQTSDARLKTDVKESDLGLDFVNNLRPVSYYWKDGDPKLHYGVIAQETEKALQQAKKFSGRENEIDNVIVTHDEKTDRYGVRYTELIAPIIKAIQELYREILNLKDEVYILKARYAIQDHAIASTKAGAETKMAQLEAENQKLKQENTAIKAYLCAKDKNADICE